MIGLRDIKLRIKSINNTKQITKAMNLVATIKFKKARENVEHVKIYLSKFKSNMQALTFADSENDFISEREVKKSLFVVVAANRGLCGAYNSSIVKKAALEAANKNAIFYAVGSKSLDFFTKRNYVIADSKLDIGDEATFADAKAISDKILELYKSHEVDEVYILYNEFISSIKFEPSIKKLLPYKVEETKQSEELYTYEPGAEVLLEEFIPRYITALVYGALLEALASELSSRMTAMSSATDNATKIIDDLSLQYNRARQAAITNELSEIIGGTEALK